MSDTITLADIDQIKAKVKNHVRPQLIDGRLCYVVVMSPPQLHDIKVMQARDDWRDYYRSVRILRKLHLENPQRARRFSGDIFMARKLP